MLFCGGDVELRLSRRFGREPRYDDYLEISPMKRYRVMLATNVLGVSALLASGEGIAQAAEGGPDSDLPIGLTVEPSGYGTLLRAEASVAADSQYVPQGANSYAGYDLSNPSEETHARAAELEGLFLEHERGNYVGRRVGENRRTIAFYFRERAAAIVKRYAPGEGFEAVNQGIPREELRPILDEWMPKLIAQRLFTDGSVNEFEGHVEIGVGVDKDAFENFLSEKGWQVPPRLRFHFSAPVARVPVEQSLQRFVRVFATSDRATGPTPLSAAYGRITLRDGCFRLNGSETLVLFPRSAALWKDDTGHMVVGTKGGEGKPDRFVRIGESIVWGGPIGIEAQDAGVAALREHCGSAAIIAVGSPSSTEGHPLDRKTAAGIPDL